VPECRELGERYTSLTSGIECREPTDGLEIIREAQDHIIKKDQALLLTKVYTKLPSG